jgi:hypothetical protein
LLRGALRVKTSSFWTCDGGAWHRNLLEGVVVGAPSPVVMVELVGGAAGSSLVRVAVGVLRAHGCWKTCAVVLGAVMTSVTAGWRRCSLRGGCYVSPWQRGKRWVRRGPHAEWPGSVGVPGAVVGVCAEAFLDLRDRQAGMCSLRMTVPWWRSSGGCWCLQRVAHRRGTTLVTTTQVSAACLGLLSHLDVDGGVSSAFVSVHGFVRVVVCASARYVTMLFLLI